MFKNIFKLFTGTLFSRLFGVIREIIVARSFGTSKIADAFTIALMFPNLFRQVLGEDMVERAFMPPFKTIYDKGEEERSWRYLSVIFNWFFILLLVATALFYFIMPLLFNLVPFFTKGADFDYSLTLKLTYIILPFMLFIGMAAFVGSLLNFFDKNWQFAFAPTMLSVGVIISLTLFNSRLGGYSIAIGYVLGAFMQFIFQLVPILSKKFRSETNFKYTLTLKDKDSNFSTIKRESVTISINAIFNKSSEIFGRFLASTIVAGATSSLFYANRLYQLPYGIISLSIVRGVNPMLNKMKATNDPKKFGELFGKAKALYYLMLIPTTLFLLLSTNEVVYLLFYGNSFGEESLNLTSSALKMYSLGLIPMSFVGYYTRVLSLFDKNKYALYISIVGAVVNIVGAILITKFTSLSHQGIALASSLSFTVNMLLLRYYIRKELPQSRAVMDIKGLSIQFIIALLLIISMKNWSVDITSKMVALGFIVLKGTIIILPFGGIFYYNRIKKQPSL